VAGVENDISFVAEFVDCVAPMDVMEEAVRADDIVKDESSTIDTIEVVVGNRAARAMTLPIAIKGRPVLISGSMKEPGPCAEMMYTMPW
jgi:hypothetical protein